MTSVARKILRDAMAMSAGDRAQVAQELLLGLEHELDQDVEEAWQQEASRRLQEIDSGDVQTVTWESVRDRLRRSQPATG
jgi:putative addiction module component (TIGR02574 family)